MNSIFDNDIVGAGLSCLLLVAYHLFLHVRLKGDPLYAGKLVSAFLLGGVAGTLGGSPLADRWGHHRLLSLSMLLTSLLFPLIRVTQGLWLFAVLAVMGMITSPHLRPNGLNIRCRP